MNIIEQTEALKDLPDQRLMQEMQAPTGFAPQFLVLSELKRRKRMRDEYQRQQAADMQTVAEETITAAGVPQGGIMQMAKALNPNSSIAQNTGMDQAPRVQPTRMADGGVVKMLKGGAVSAQPDGQGGYILVQRNQQISDRRFPNFSEANAAARALRDSDAQPFQVDRILSGFETIGPAMPEEPSALSMVNPDPQAFVANDPMRRQLQLRQAAGTREDPSVGGIASLDPLGRAFMDEYRADMSGMQGIPSGGEGVGVVDNLQTLMPAYQEQTIPDAALPAAPRFVSEDQRTEEDAKLELARMAGAVPLADMVSEMGSNKPVDFDASAPAPLSEVDLMRRVARTTGMVRPDVDFADPTMVPDPSFGVDPIIQEKVDLTPALLDSLPGVISGKTPNEKASQIGNFLRSIPVADEFTGTGSSSEGVDVGIPMPSPDRPTLDVTVPDQPPTSLPDSMLEVEDDPVTRVIKSIDDGAEELVLPSTKGGDDDSGGDGGDGGGDTPTTTRTGTGTGSAMSSIEERIAKMLDEREKGVESDKWMALAQAGMALMSSKSPTLGGAIGEAGLAGIGALKKGKAQYDKDVLSLLGMQQKIDAAKDLSAYRQATLDAAAKKAALPKGLSASEKNKFLGEAGDLFEKIQELEAIIGSGSEVINNLPYPLSEERIAALTAQRNALQSQYNKYIGLVNPQLANIQTAQ